MKKITEDFAELFDSAADEDMMFPEEIVEDKFDPEELNDGELDQLSIDNEPTKEEISRYYASNSYADEAEVVYDYMDRLNIPEEEQEEFLAVALNKFINITPEGNFTEFSDSYDIDPLQEGIVDFFKSTGEAVKKGLLKLFTPSGEKKTEVDPQDEQQLNKVLAHMGKNPGMALLSENKCKLIERVVAVPGTFKVFNKDTAIGDDFSGQNTAQMEKALKFISNRPGVRLVSMDPEELTDHEKSIKAKRDHEDRFYGPGTRTYGRKYPNTIPGQSFNESKIQEGGPRVNIDYEGIAHQICLIKDQGARQAAVDKLFKLIAEKNAEQAEKEIKKAAKSAGVTAQG